MCCLLYEKDIYEGMLVEEGKEYIKLVDEEAGGELLYNHSHLLC